MKYGAISPLLLAAALFGASVAKADVKAGVDAWAQGDFASAVAEWLPLAERGNADAQFNLGQAYKLGRGVPMNLVTALEWYRKAAAQGHIRAEDNYGLLLFQQNRRPEAMPFLLRSAMRDEPRAQYLVGTALFNGDLIQRDWIKAYALMSRAAASGLPQAANALAQMDTHVTDDQRRQGIAMADAMAGKAKAREEAIASADPPRNMQPKASVLRSDPIVTPAKAAAPNQDSGWRVQLGAFSDRTRAEAHWRMISAKISALSEHPPLIEPAGNLFRLQATGLNNRGDAATLCRAITAAGADCIVKY
jgi:hypothetical protein